MIFFVARPDKNKYQGYNSTSFPGYLLVPTAKWTGILFTDVAYFFRAKPENTNQQ